MKQQQVSRSCNSNPLDAVMSQLPLFAPRSDLNGVAPAVTAPSMPGHSVGLSLPRSYRFVGQLASADGWWVSACKSADVFADLYPSDASHIGLLSHRVRSAYRVGA